VGVVRVPHVALGVYVSARLDEVVEDARVAFLRGPVEGGVSPLERERSQEKEATRRKHRERGRKRKRTKRARVRGADTHRKAERQEVTVGVIKRRAGWQKVN